MVARVLSLGKRSDYLIGIALAIILLGALVAVMIHDSKKTAIPNSGDKTLAQAKKTNQIPEEIIKSACNNVVHISGTITCQEALTVTARDYNIIRVLKTSLEGGGNRPIVYRFKLETATDGNICITVDAVNGNIIEKKAC